MTSHNRTIVVDIDGVCLDYVAGFVGWAQEEYKWGLDPNSSYETYNMASWFIDSYCVNMKPPQFLDLVEEYNNYPRCMPPIQGSQEALKRLKEEGYTIIAISSFGGTKRTQRFRREYLEVMFPGVFNHIILLGLGECKKSTLSDLSSFLSVEYYVEDHKDHAEKGAGLGIFTFLLRTSYNNGAEDVCYVDDWRQILNIIEERAKND